MMTVHEVSKLAGVSIRTLQYYDKIGLLHPTGQDTPMQATDCMTMQIWSAFNTYYCFVNQSFHLKTSRQL